MSPRCRKCGEPLPNSYIGPSCPVCEYEQSIGHRLERIPGRPVMAEVEVLRLLEIEPEPVLPADVIELELYRGAVEAA